MTNKKFNKKQKTMKKLLLLTKTLLAAALLCVGQNAWGETIKETYDFKTFITSQTNATKGGESVGSYTGPSTYNGNLYLLNNPVQSEQTLDLNGRFAIDYGSKDNVKIRFLWRTDASAEYKKGLAGQWNGNGTASGGPSNGACHLSILNLKAGNKITVVYSVSKNEAKPHVCNSGVITGIAADAELTSGTQYTIAADGNLDIYFADNNFGIHQVIIERDATVADAIADCKAHETSAAFATAVDAQSFANPAAVYAFHTAWQVENASSNDITKVIFDAGVSDFSRWNNARNNSGQQYTGAPDNKYFDGWYNQASDASQTIYGLPAGTYTLKVATRASAEATNTNNYNVWVNGGTANVKVLGNHIGSTGGCLGNGWNWTIASFTLDATANVSIGFYAKPGNSGDTKYWAGADDWHLYKGSLSETATIGAKGYTTFSSSCPLNLASISGGTAYKVIASDVDGTVVTPSAVTGSIAAGEGLILSGTPNSKVTIPVVASGDAISGNLMVGCPIGATINKETSNYEKFYVLVNDETVAKFANLTDWVGADKTVNIPANKAYLNIPSPSARSMSIVLGDKVTGVANVEAAAEAKAKEGKFIENGKLVIVKNGQKFNAAGAKLY